MLKLYNTLTRKKERFTPISDNTVKMYSCGLTVYYLPHIGNMRKYVGDDLIRRVLIHDGYKVDHVENITDVGHLASDADEGEDKLRLKAEKEHKSMHEIAEFYTRIALGDFAALNITIPERMVKASDHVPEMISLLKQLDEKGYLYKAENGIYFDTSKFKGYGALTGMSFDELNTKLKAGARVEMIKGKRHITDFAVWRFATPGMKEMVWDSPWGRGWPGWHIECSTLSMEYLGKHFDIHTGGVDHIQIHHTNEIAQSEAATGAKVVEYWMHFEFLIVGGTKMSKSLGNIYTVQDIIAKGYSPMALRLFMISGHYRQLLNFTLEALTNTENTLKGVYLFLEHISAVKNNTKNDDTEGFKKGINNHKKLFFKALDDDINTPQALAEMHAVISETNSRAGSGKLNRSEARYVARAMLEFDEVLGLRFDEHVNVKKAPLDKEVQKLVDEREDARRSKDFQKADEIRRTLKDRYHIVLEDTKEGVRWHRES